MKIIDELQNAAQAPITSMSASFTSKAYAIGKNSMLANQFGFNAGDLPVGTFFIDYSCTPVEDINRGVTPAWSSFASLAVVATDSDALFLDANVPAVSYRIRWVRTSGGGAFSYYANHKNLISV